MKYSGKKLQNEKAGNNSTNSNFQREKNYKKQKK
jgi:hypothetical protein